MDFWRKPLDFDQMKVPHGEVRIIVERCKGCGFCVEYCPKDVLVMSTEFNRKGYHPPKVVKSGECVNCSLCEMICPDFAIFSVPGCDGPPAAAGEDAAVAVATAPRTTAAAAAAGGAARCRLPPEKEDAR